MQLKFYIATTNVTAWWKFLGINFRNGRLVLKGSTADQTDCLFQSTVKVNKKEKPKSNPGKINNDKLLSRCCYIFLGL